MGPLDPITNGRELSLEKVLHTWSTSTYIGSPDIVLPCVCDLNAQVWPVSGTYFAFWKVLRYIPAHRTRSEMASC